MLQHLVGIHSGILSQNKTKKTVTKMTQRNNGSDQINTSFGTKQITKTLHWCVTLSSDKQSIETISSFSIIKTLKFALLKALFQNTVITLGTFSSVADRQVSSTNAGDSMATSYREEHERGVRLVLVLRLVGRNDVVRQTLLPIRALPGSKRTRTDRKQ